MSWGTCYAGSNNIHFDFPPMMEDGRLYTSYEQETAIDKRIKKQEHIQSNWQYRQFLQNNGNSIMQLNYKEYCQDIGLVSPVITLTQTPAQNVPYSFRSSFDHTSPGYGYYSSDLKTPYLSREQLQARMISPYIQVPKNK
jgi:hypothetical protein